MLMAITFSGSFAVYSMNTNRTIEKIFSQSLLNSIPKGVYCAEIDTKCEFLMIGSFTSSTSNGLSVWRILNHEPWIQLFDTEQAKTNSVDKVS